MEPGRGAIWWTLECFITIVVLLKCYNVYHKDPAFSFHQPTTLGSGLPTPISFAGEKKDNTGSKIVILDIRPLKEQSLLP